MMQLVKPESDWSVLSITGHLAHEIGPHVQQVVISDLVWSESTEVVIDGLRLPFADNHFSLIVCRLSERCWPDTYRLMVDCARVIQPGGWLLVHDMVAPDKAKAARYVNAFLRLGHSTHRQAYSQYELEGLLLDAGLSVKATETASRTVKLLDWTDRRAELDHLQIMLVQAPEAVSEWMRPQYAGTDYATFEIREVAILGQKHG
jgi:SAM-dependent methyltransferase